MARRAPDRSRCFPFSIPASRPPPRFQRPRLRSFALPPTRAFPARNSVPLRQAATDGICVSGGSAESSARSGTDRFLCIGFTDRSGRAALPRRQNARSQILDAGLTLPDLCTRRVFCRFGAPSLLETGIDIGRVDSSSENPPTRVRAGGGSSKGRPQGWPQTAPCGTRGAGSLPSAPSRLEKPWFARITRPSEGRIDCPECHRASFAANLQVRPAYVNPGLSERARPFKNLFERGLWGYSRRVAARRSEVCREFSMRSLGVLDPRWIDIGTALDFADDLPNPRWVGAGDVWLFCKRNSSSSMLLSNECRTVREGMETMRLIQLLKGAEIGRAHRPTGSFRRIRVASSER